MKKLKIALIGAGGMGNVHSQVYKSMPEIKVTAVVDVTQEKAQKIAYEHGAKVYKSIDDMFKEEKPDIIDICTPTYIQIWCSFYDRACNKILA